ncbi:MAG: hypothetical protein PHW76_07790 [Alphaproteobacteria bacterium]|nr:hypothetical protein [Alphaproteobacteria bacterium]
MSEELPFHKPPLNERRFKSNPRLLTSQEKDFLKLILMHGEGGNERLSKLDSYIVQEMDDGGMGSLYFRAIGDDRQMRHRKRSLVDVEFSDLDGVQVSVSLTLDENGEIFELDIWKVNFCPLLSFPKPQDIRIKRQQDQ